MRKRRRVFEILLEDKAFKIPGLHVATDYASILLSSKELELDKSTMDVIYRDEGQLQPGAGTWVTPVVLTQELPLNLDKLVEYIKNPAHTHSDVFKEGCLQALNIIVKQTPNSNPGIFSSAQNAKFYAGTGESGKLTSKKLVKLAQGKRAPAEVPTCLVALKGYQTSVRTSIRRLLVNVHVSTSAFYQEGPVYKIIDLLERASAEDFLRNRRIRTEYTNSYKYRAIRGYARDPVTKKIMHSSEYYHQALGRGPRGRRNYYCRLL